MSDINHTHKKATKLNDGRVKKYLKFDLGGEEFGVPLSAVKEVIGSPQIRALPQSPDYFSGMINLRGRVISIIDLRVKLNLKKSESDDSQTPVIIFELEGITLGAIVDDVLEVAGLTPEQIEASLEIQSNIERQFISGVSKSEDNHLTVLLDIANVLAVEEFKMLKKAAESADQESSLKTAS